MSLIPTDDVDMSAVRQIAREVEGAVDPNNGSMVRFKEALDANGATLEDVAAHLAQHLSDSNKPNIQARAIKVILEVHGMVGAQKDSANKGDINVVIHTNNANVQANQMLNPQRVLGDPKEHAEYGKDCST